MTLVTLKLGGTWQTITAIFRLPATSFMEAVTKFIQFIASKLYADQVETREDEITMRAATSFEHFLCALHAVDMTFQQSWRPGGSIQENGKYFGGKHQLYGLKVEVSVNSNGQQGIPQKKMKKLPGDDRLQDDSLLKDKFPNEWEIVADKGYQGLANCMRCIHPKNERTLSRAEWLSTIRRLNACWRITADKFRWSENIYDDLFCLTVSLTNHHVSISPLREQNNEWYRQTQHKLIELGLAIKGKRRLAQEKCHAKKRLL
ncbi:hypothetical protein PHMEG_00039453 [Phytophthora megakarya]|uniref:DDE Tnp4 domain-containing protein n=1 Tax=Phytophthora megakarya TaxID=4795 RepID=A0A225UFQ3_9STRA|nr:hypothetical protein PHMEG_00039453 [Phytophthora megakarya]